jgi:hypothetical protein
METELFVQSLSLSLFFLVKIKNLPSLVGTVVSWMDLNLLSFSIFSLVYIQAFVGLLDVTEVFTLIEEDLEPL